jgi:antitoxin VapB
MTNLLATSNSKEARLFRNNRSQAVRIPVEFELQCDRVTIRREGVKLIIEPISQPTNIVELLAAWKMEPPLGPEDQFPEVKDVHAQPEDIL